MKKSVDAAVAAYRAIVAKDAKLVELAPEEKGAFFKALYALKKVTGEFDDVLNEARERFKPKGIEAIAQKQQAGEALTDDDRAVLDKWNADVAAAVQEDLAKEVEFDFEPFSEDALTRLGAANNFSAREFLTINAVLGA